MNDPLFDDRSKPFDAPDAVFSPEPPEKKPRGCFFYGCLFAGIIGVIGLIAAVALGIVAWNFWSGLLRDYTSTAPAPIPSVEMPAEDRKALDERWAAFKSALDKNESAEIVLTADDVNALLEEDERINHKVYVSINDDQVTGQVSIPLGDTGIPGTKGRFFNGKATATVSVKNGELYVYVKELEANGKALPKQAKDQLAGQNFARDVNNNPEQARYIRKFESIVVKGGKIYIKTRSESDQAKDREKESENARDKDDKDKSDEKPKDEPATGKDAAPSKDDAPARSDDKPKGDEPPRTDAPEKPAGEPKRSAA